MTEAINTSIKSWDDVDEQLFHCVVLSGMLWDLATDLGYQAPERPEDVDRVHTLSRVLKERLERFRDDAEKTDLRKRRGVA